MDLGQTPSSGEYAAPVKVGLKRQIVVAPTLHRGRRGMEPTLVVPIPTGADRGVSKSGHSDIACGTMGAVVSVVKILTEMRANPRNVSFTELTKVCEHYFGPPRRSGGSHRVYRTPWQGDPLE